MKITYIKLKNVAGIYVGMNLKELEIDFSKSVNKIIAISAKNGSGKTVLLSSLTPFSGVTSLDERSSMSYILEKEDGYKEIHYKNNDDIYIIKHYYKATKDSHSVKSYFMKNGEELNENGNVTTFNMLVEIHLGLTQDMMRLIRIGSNVSSFISLTPARRKEYIGKLIDEIDIYMNIYKKISDEIRVVKTLITSNNTNLYNCHISDPIIEEEKLREIGKSIKEYEKERDKIISEIGRIDSLIAGNDINDLKRKKQEAEIGIREFDKVVESIKSMKLEGVSLDQLIKKRSDLSSDKISIQSKINSYRISIDNALKNIERLEINIKKITSNNDIQSLINAIESLQETMKNVNNVIKGFNSLGTSSEDMIDIVNKISSYNQIGQMIYTLGNKPIEVYLKLRSDKRSIDKFLKDQMKKNLSRINESDLRVLISQLFQDDEIIFPNCDTEYADCPYYRLSETLNKIRDNIDEDIYDDETLRSIQIISRNIDNILNGIDVITRKRLPDMLKDELKEDNILKRLSGKLSLIDISGFQEYLGIVREYEIYKQNQDKLKDYEYQLSIYKKSGIDSHLSEIDHLRENISFYKSNISSLESDINRVESELSSIDDKILLVTKYNDSKKYRKVFEDTLESTNKILAPLESASKEKMELEFSLRQYNNLISSSRERYNELERKIAEYNRLVEESKDLAKRNKDLTFIQKSTYTKEGIPVSYINKYLGKIQKFANELLRIIYDDNPRLAKFKVDGDVFEVPYIKNGKKISDIKYASQSELAMMTIALSFALSKNASDQYNIILLDEIDSGLDEDNRIKFLKMLYVQMNVLNAEQVFIISQNLTQMTNVPMDVIMLNETGNKSRLQNIIYE